MSMSTQDSQTKLARSRVGYCSPMTAQNGSDHWWHKWVEYSRYRENRCNPSPCHLPNKDMTYQLINHSCVLSKRSHKTLGNCQKIMRMCWKMLEIHSSKNHKKLSSLLDQQGSRRIVPGIQVHLEPSIQASTRKPGKVHRGRAQDADCPSIGIRGKKSLIATFFLVASSAFKCGS